MTLSNYVSARDPGGWIAIGLTRGWAGLLQILCKLYKSRPHKEDYLGLRDLFFFFFFFFDLLFFFFLRCFRL